MGRDGGDVELRVTANTDDAEKKLSGIGSGADSAFSKISKGAATAVKAVTAITAAAGAAGVAITQIGTEWETSFAKVQTIMDTTQLSTAEMKQQILDLSTESGIAASELSNSVYNAISATGDTANAVALVGTASQLATAGFADTESSLNVLNTAINAYGLETSEAQRISDSLIQTQNLGVTTVAELAAGMGKAIASASAYGVDLSNVEATYVAMTKSGISTAESTTYMSSMFKELGDSGKDVAKALKSETGKSFSELMAEGWSLADCLGVIYKAAGNDSTALMNMWGSAEAGKAANAIINQGLDTFNSNLDAISNSAGMTETAYETMCNTVEHQTDVLKNTVKNLGISLYEDFSPEITSMLKDVNSWTTELATAFSEGGVTALGTTATKLLPKATTMITTLATNAVKGLSKIAPTIGNTLAGMIPNMITSSGDILSSLVDGLSSLLSSAAESIGSNLPEILGSIGTALPTVLTSLVSGAYSVIESLVDGLEQSFHQGMTKLVNGQWVDNSEISTLDLDLNAHMTPQVEISETDLAAARESAANTLSTAMQGVSKDITPVKASELASAMISGDTSDALKTILVSAGVDETAATTAANTIEQAQKKINTVVSGLGLSASAKAHLNNLISGGATKEKIEEYLTSCGVDPSVAKESADTIDKARKKITKAISKLPKEVQSKIKNIDFTSDRATFISAIKALKLTPEEYQEVLDSYDACHNSLVSGIQGIFQNITDTMTDGETDTAGEVSGLESQVRGWAQTAYDQIETWYQDELKNLADKGLSAEAQAQAEEALTTKRDEMVSGIGSAVEDTVEGVYKAANLSGAELDTQMARLGEVEARIEGIAGQIDELESSANKIAGEGSFNSIAAGLTDNEVTLSQGISFVFSDFNFKYDGFEAEYKAAQKELDDLLASESISGEAYTEASEALSAEYSERLQSQLTEFQTNLGYLVTGLADYAGISSETITQAMTGADMGAAVFSAFDQGMNSGWEQGMLTVGSSFSDLSGEYLDAIASALNIDASQLDLSGMVDGFKNLGLSDELADALLSELGEGGSGLTAATQSALKEWASGLTASSSDALAAIQASPIGAMIGEMIEQNVFDGIEGVDLNADGVLDFMEVWQYMQNGIDNAMKNPFTLNADYEVTDGEVVGETDPEGVLTKYYDATGAVHYKVEVPVDFEPDETSDGALQEKLAQKSQEAAEGASGETITVEQTVETEYTYTTIEETPIEDAGGISDGETLDTITASQEIVIEATPEVTGVDGVGAEIDATVAEGITGGAGTVNAAATGVVSGTATSWASGAVSAAASGLVTAAGYAAGILSGSSTASSNAESVAGSAESGFGSVDASGAGSDFAAGYARGISSGKNAAVSAAVALAKAALTAVKSTQDSASPSKETAKLGRYFGEGYEVGIEESMANAVQTAKRMTGEVLSASVIGSNGLGVLRVEAGSEPLQVSMDGADAPVYLDGKQIATIQGGNNRSELAWLQQRTNRGYGR